MRVRLIREFINLETSAGIVLFCTALLALIIANSPWQNYYYSFFQLELSIHLGALELSKPLLLWINDGFMAIFFLLVGLEIKRELIEGELNTIAKASLPGIAAIGGMVVPALIYVYFNYHDGVALRGWAIPTATDIAFSLGILALLGSRIPVSLKIFLTALAIIDDIGAIIVIAIFYTRNVSLGLLLIALAFVALLILLNRFKVASFSPYVLVGIALWFCVLKSGVHATLAGIILAFTIPLRDPKKPTRSPARRLERRLHPWVAFGILPLFAFANAGVSFRGLSAEELFGSIPVGIALGLFLGKQIGIWLATYLGIKFKIARMPRGVNKKGIYGVGLIAGVGFTMSLFIGSLAFGRLGGSYPAMVRTGVIIGSLLSGVLGYIVLRFTYSGKGEKI